MTRVVLSVLCLAAVVCTPTARGDEPAPKHWAFQPIQRPPGPAPPTPHSGGGGAAPPPRGGGPPARHRQLVATGFLALGPKVLAEPDPRKMELDIVDEQIDTLGRSVLGLTLGCARCHDHK